jgi:hypothetical protein
VTKGTGTGAFEVLKAAIEKVPAVKYALGVAGLAAAVAIIKTLLTDWLVAVVGVIVLVFLMVLLFVFAKLTAIARKDLRAPMMVLLWSALALTIATGTLLFLSIFFEWPISLKHWITGQRPPSTSRDSDQSLDRIDVSDVGFLDYPDDSRSPRLDIKLTNIGTRSAFVKRVKFNVKQVWRLNDLPQAAGVVVPPEHNYVLKLRSSANPYSVILPVAHGLKPDDFGRFTVQLEEDPWPSSNTIYLANVEIVANSNDATFRSEDLLFLITQSGTTFPDSKMLQEIIRSERSLGRQIDREKLHNVIVANKAMVFEASKHRATRSPGIERLIETAQGSDL